MSITAQTKDHVADSGVGGAADRIVDAWFAEARRLFDEAEGRLADGAPLSALSSLVAVPPLHRMIVDRCSELLNEAGNMSHEDEPPLGMYL